MSKPYTKAQLFLLQSADWPRIVLQQTNILATHMQASVAYPGALRSAPTPYISVLYDTGLAILANTGIRSYAHGLYQGQELHWDTAEQLHLWLYPHLAHLRPPLSAESHDCFYKPLTLLMYPGMLSYEAVIADLPYPLGNVRVSNIATLRKRYQSAYLQLCYFTKRGIINTADMLIDHEDVYACMYALTSTSVRGSYIVYKDNRFVNDCLNDIYGIDGKELNVGVRRRTLAELKAYLGLPNI